MRRWHRQLHGCLRANNDVVSGLSREKVLYDRVEMLCDKVDSLKPRLSCEVGIVVHQIQNVKGELVGAVDWLRKCTEHSNKYVRHNEN